MYKQQLRIGTLEVLWLENTNQFHYLCSKYNVSLLYADKCVFIKGNNYHAAEQEIEYRLAQYQVELLNVGPYSREIYADLCQKYEGLWITNYRELVHLLSRLRERNNYTAQLPNLPPDYMIMWLPKNLKDKILSMLYSKYINITPKETLTFLLVLDFARIESEFGVILRIQQRNNKFFMILEGKNIDRPLRIIDETLRTRVLFQYFHPEIELTSDDLDYCEKQLSRYRVSLFSYQEVASKQLDCDEFVSDYNSTFVFAPALEQNFIIEQLSLIFKQIDAERHPKIQRQENKLLLINQEQLSNFVRRVYSDEECYQIFYKNEKDNFDLQSVEDEFFKFIKELSYISVDVSRDLIQIRTREQYQKFCAICDEFFVGSQYVIFNSKAQNYLEHLKKEYNIEYKRTSSTGLLTKLLYEIIDNDDDGQNFACKIWIYLCHDEEFKNQLEQIDIIEEVQVQQESGNIKVLSQNQIEYLQSQQIEFTILAFYGKYMDSRYNFVKLESPLKNEIHTELLQIAYKEVESYVIKSPSMTQINQYCWKIHIQQNALLFYKHLVRELLNYEGDLQASEFKLREIFIDIGSQQVNCVDEVQKMLRDPANLVCEKAPSRNYLTALTQIQQLPMNAAQLNPETTLIREEQRSNKNTAKVVPRGSKEISNILGDRRSSYNIDGYDRVEELTIEQQKSIPLIDKAVIVLVVLFTLLVFINFSFTSNDASTNSDIYETLFIVKIIELVILILFVLEISVRCWDLGFMTYFSDWWSIFDAIIIIASIVLIILDLNLDGSAFTTISKVLRGIFRFLRLFLVFRKYNQVKKINNAGARYNVRSPVEKVIEIMRDLADQFEDPDIIKQLNWGITHISNNTVYEPIIEGRKSEALGWLNQQQQQIAQDLKRSMSGDVLYGDDAHVPEVLVKDFDLNILNLDYDYFALYQKYDSAMLTHLMCYYFQKHQLFSSLRISPESFKKCVDRLGTSYHKENPYHNVIHAFDVTHTVYFFIERCNFKEVGKLSNLDYAVLLLAASAHDVDHPGLNNIFLANSRHDLAMTYNDKSPLEQHHAATLFKYIRDSDLLIHFTLTDLKYFREKVINMILSTDNAMHGKDYNKLKARLASNDFEPGSKDKGICFDTLLHAADISNPFKPMKNYEQWTFRVLGEFWLQGDREKELGLPVTMLCDRRTTNVAKSQIGFIDFMVLPYYNTLTQILPQLGEFLEQITENKKAWAEQIDHYQTLMNTQ